MDAPMYHILFGCIRTVVFLIVFSHFSRKFPRNIREVAKKRLFFGKIREI